jgi:hypothetical protein
MQIRLIWLLAAAFCLLAFGQSAFAGARNGACEMPKDLQAEVTRKYPGTSLVTLSDLDDTNKESFQKEHKDECPGLVKVDFYGDGKPTLALALIANSVQGAKVELIVARQVVDNWKMTMLASVDGAAAAIWSEGPGEYVDMCRNGKIRSTRPVIIFCRNYKWMVLYAWKGNRVVKFSLAS